MPPSLVVEVVVVLVSVTVVSPLSIVEVLLDTALELVLELVPLEVEVVAADDVTRLKPEDDGPAEVLLLLPEDVGTIVIVLIDDPDMLVVDTIPSDIEDAVDDVKLSVAVTKEELVDKTLLGVMVAEDTSTLEGPELAAELLVLEKDDADTVPALELELAWLGMVATSRAAFARLTGARLFVLALR